MEFRTEKDLAEGMQLLWGLTPLEVMDLLYYFDMYYMSETAGETPKLLFPPGIWNVHLTRPSDSHRTNNMWTTDSGTWLAIFIPQYGQLSRRFEGMKRWRGQTSSKKLWKKLEVRPQNSCRRFKQLCEQYWVSKSIWIEYVFSKNKF